MSEHDRKKTLNILGATGSIGRNTLDLVAHHSNAFKIGVLTADSNYKDLAQLARQYKASHAVIANDQYYNELKSLLDDTNIQVMAGREALIEASAITADITMAAIVGTDGLQPCLSAIRQGNIVAFASKECLVAAGKLMMQEVHNSGATLLPVDSEHNAIFQVFERNNREHIKRLILTASGGPFRTWSPEKMAKATPSQAVAHPTWSMGAKISVDSATLMNKALEVIEAVHLFDLPHEQVDVVVHPQSLIHSMVEYVDGSILSQMGPSDMRTPIASCLAWPERIATSGPSLDIMQVSQLNFEQPDLQRFPSLSIVRDVLSAHDQAKGIIFNACNEIAVDAFLKEKIDFPSIVLTVQWGLETIASAPIKNLDDVIDFDQQVKYITRDFIKNKLKTNKDRKIVHYG